MSTTAPSRTQPAWPAAAVGWLAVVGVVGSAFMALAHLGVTLPLVGDTPYIAPVAASFAGRTSRPSPRASRSAQSCTR